MTACGRGCSADTSCILDGEENDACEVLHLLVSIITDELHEHFLEHKSVALSSQTALQDILSLSQSCSSPNTVHSASSIDTRVRSVAADTSAECCLSGQGSREPNRKITLQPGSAALAHQEDALDDPGMSAAEVPLPGSRSTSINTFTGDSRAQETARGAGSVHASKGASPAHVRVHAAEQGEPTLAAWRACRSPLELSQSQEVVCLVCQKHTSKTMSSAVALPLVLPSVKVCMHTTHAKELCKNKITPAGSTLYVTWEKTLTAARIAEDAEAVKICP